MDIAERGSLRDTQSNRHSSLFSIMPEDTIKAVEIL
jgi:hypothetical protein